MDSKAFRIVLTIKDLQLHRKNYFDPMQAFPADLNNDDETYILKTVIDGSTKSFKVYQLSISISRQPVNCRSLLKTALCLIQTYRGLIQKLNSLLKTRMVSSETLIFFEFI